jgi:hypothetical protein
MNRWEIYLIKGLCFRMSSNQESEKCKHNRVCASVDGECAIPASRINGDLSLPAKGSA